MIAIPNMSKPKRCAECFRILICKSVPRWVTTDDSIPKSCPLIEIVTCGECKWYCDFEGCVFSTDGLKPDDFCSYGERRADEHTDKRD